MMILGAILRNYKCYKGLHYIPFYKDHTENLNVIIGDNGAGKSTILEALDSFFNDASWVINSESNLKDAAVGGVFLMEKEKCNAVLDEKEQEIFLKISDAFWEVDKKSNSSYEKNYTEFFEQRHRLVSQKSAYYLFVAGKQYGEHEIGFLSFDNSVDNRLEELTTKPNTQSISSIINKVVNIFSYLYIPVETTISNFLRLETAGMQTLSDKNLKNAITDALNDKRITRTIEKNNKKKKLSVIDLINERLEQYINDVQNEIQKIDSTYDFKPDYRQPSKLSPNHIANVIIDAFYAKRKLKKDKKPISTLSSGEKRRALIDIIYVFLSKNVIDRHLVLAIDEPESSLHISKCYDQFRKIQDIAIRYNQQLFITTHWYGSLPILKSGNLMYIQPNQQIKMFNLSNYFEERGNHPDDINLKSFFDLSASIISAYRNSKCHWLLVEGIEDKMYLNYYLANDNIQIIPLSGCGNVKKVYEYLFTPMSNSKQEIPDKKDPKILCIVDTDFQNTPLNVDSSTKNKQLLIRRWNEDASTHQIELFTIENPTFNQTEIEEILEPTLFYNALKTCIDNKGSEEEKMAFEAFEFDNSVINSRIKGDYSILNHLGNGRNMRQDKEVVNAFVDRMKHEIAETYIQLPKTGNVPYWVGLINNILNN